MNWVHQRFVSMVQVLFPSLVTISNHMAWRPHPPFTWLVEGPIKVMLSYLLGYPICSPILKYQLGWYHDFKLYCYTFIVSYTIVYSCMEVWRFWCFLSSAQNNYMLTGKWKELRTARWEIFLFQIWIYCTWNVLQNCFRIESERYNKTFTDCILWQYYFCQTS